MVSSNLLRKCTAMVVLVGLSACSSVTIRTQGGEKDTSVPSYMDSCRRHSKTAAICRILK